MHEQAVYNSEDGRWYRNGETPWVVRVVARGEKLIPFFNVKADTCIEAFEQLYGHAVSETYPALRREARNQN